ncbi:MAG: tRNA (adenosine(37)-N6)-threonylcarbamoyltransferase complex ATPase subunit type 1 TsaE [Flavobacteriales bacterium]
MTHRIKSVLELETVASDWLQKYPEPTVCLLKGEMGTGKTTFVKAICNALKVEEQVTSPTFSLVNEYVAIDELKIFHFDLYRLKNEEELYDIGFEEYLDRNAYVFIEWPEIAGQFFLTNTPSVKIQLENDFRLITF